MSEKYHVANIDEVFHGGNDKVVSYEGIVFSVYGRDDDFLPLQCPESINAFYYILVLSGYVDVEVNHFRFRLERGDLLMLSALHIFRVVDRSDDFRSETLFVGRSFMDMTYSTDMIYNRIRYGITLYDSPVVHLSDEDFGILRHRILEVSESLLRSSHLFYRELILQSLMGFYLELGNVVEAGHSERSTNESRYLKMISSFLVLLISNFKREHDVGFYASQLCITPHYLTRVVKSYAGQTVSDIVYEMLFSKARTMLANSRLSVKQISDELNFSDQSAFGKFFRRKAGVSPLEFRKRL